MQQFLPTFGLDRVLSDVSKKKKRIYYSTCSFSAVSGITRWTSLIDVESISPLLSTVSIDSPLLLLSETVEFPNIEAELILHIICKSVIKPSHISEKKINTNDLNSSFGGVNMSLFATSSFLIFFQMLVFI